jgi:hypothetical protein
VPRLKLLLEKHDPKQEAIKGAECRSLAFEVEGDLRRAIDQRKKEMRLIKCFIKHDKWIGDYGTKELRNRHLILKSLSREASRVGSGVASKIRKCGVI